MDISFYDGRVFEYITMHKQSSVEAMSLEVGITQRAVFKIIKTWKAMATSPGRK